jgi:anthranilate phosphoribosyltransferase
MVIYGQGPQEGLFLDEVSNVGETIITELRDQAVETYTVAPEDFGLKRSTPEAIRGGETLSEQTQLLVDILKGRERGPRRDIVLMNTAVLLCLAGKVADFKAGTEAASQSIDSGAALEKLRGLVEKSGGDLEKLEVFVKPRM